MRQFIVIFIIIVSFTAILTTISRNIIAFTAQRNIFLVIVVLYLRCFNYLLWLCFSRQWLRCGSIMNKLLNDLFRGSKTLILILGCSAFIWLLGACTIFLSFAIERVAGSTLLLLGMLNLHILKILLELRVSKYQLCSLWIKSFTLFCYLSQLLLIALLLLVFKPAL
jgi:hypothetical protein